LCIRERCCMKSKQKSRRHSRTAATGLKNYRFWNYCSPGAFKTDRSFRRCGVWKCCSSERNITRVAELKHVTERDGCWTINRQAVRKYSLKLGAMGANEKTARRRPAESEAAVILARWAGWLALPRCCLRSWVQYRSSLALVRSPHAQSRPKPVSNAAPAAVSVCGDCRGWSWFRPRRVEF